MIPINSSMVFWTTISTVIPVNPIRRSMATGYTRFLRNEDVFLCLSSSFLFVSISVRRPLRPDCSSPFLSRSRLFGRLYSSWRTGRWSKDMGAGVTYELPVLWACLRRRRSDSSSRAHAKYSSLTSRRNFGLTRYRPTTSNNRTNPKGVHTKSVGKKN